MFGGAAVLRSIGTGWLVRARQACRLLDVAVDPASHSDDRHVTIESGPPTIPSWAIIT